VGILVSSERISIAPIGMRKKMASHRTPGAVSPYGARRLRPRAFFCFSP